MKHISQDGLAIVKAFEGCLRPVGDGKFKPYICPAGVLTIGWGHTNHHGRKFDEFSVWTQQDCDLALAADMAGFERAVERHVTVTLLQFQFDALVSFAYNCGEGNLAKSTLLRKVNGGDFSGAAGEFARWNRGGGKELAGLTRRRKAEALLFRNKRAEAFVVAQVKDGPMPQRADVPQVPSAPNARKAATGTVIAGGAVVAKTTHETYGWSVVVPVVLIAIIAAVLIWRAWPKKKG